MPLEHILTRATLRVRHERPYDYDERRCLWRYERLDEDEEYRNILTNAGCVAIHTFIYGTAVQRASANLGSGFHFVGVSNDSSSPVAGDTSLAGELSTAGLSRALGVVTLPTGVGTITQIQKQFTYTGGATQGVQKTALFDVVAGGHMAHELVFSQRIMNAADTLTLIFNVTVSGGL